MTLSGGNTNKMPHSEIKTFLDEAYFKYNQQNFIADDPISIPHQFTKKEDIEISAFLMASLAWGNRKSIIQNGNKLMKLMDEAPHDFIVNHSKQERSVFGKFVHRTFNGIDCMFFIHALQVLYQKHGGLEGAFYMESKNENIKANIMAFRTKFLSINHLSRSEKHISNPDKNSSAKRLSMYLRWMVRKDKKGVDFGLWKGISSAQLCLPLDVHTGNVSRQLGLLKRSQNDWKAVEEITETLKSFDALDPVKYDFALFGLGANKALAF